MQRVDDPITEVKVKLIGEDGNAFAIMAKVKKALREAGFSGDFIRIFEQQCMAGNYDDLLQTVMSYVEVE